MSRHQNGYIFKLGRSWFGRWREDSIVEGKVVRTQRCEKLADYCDRYRCKADVRPLLVEKLKPINERKLRPEATLTVAEYAENFYLPRIEREFKPSTAAGYRTFWKTYLMSQREMQLRLRDFRCVDATNLLAAIHYKHGISRSTLKRVKSILSGIFTYAKQQGALDGPNPIEDAAIPRAAKGPQETYAISAEDVLAILSILERAGECQARAAVALMFFAGLRPGEARGVCWEDYDGQKLTVRRAIWHTHVTDPKTAGSAKPVPVIEPLRSILHELREYNGNKAVGPILRGPTGIPLNLDNLAKRRLVPALKNPKNYPAPENAKLLVWRGWYSLRRGIATLTSSIERDPMAAKGLLRHSSVNTTLKHYIKEVPEVTERAMQKVEALLAGCPGSEAN
jgi:integrase